MLMSALKPEPQTVLCLCAAWCGSCRDYRDTFDRAAAGHPADTFVWIDIEDEADLVDDIDVENFPTLLIGQGDTVRFFGPVTPHAGTLERLLSSLDGASAGGAPADALLRRVRQR
ncbi:MAG: thioredoxin family protein [Rhizobacter sp.]|nr:thioredoxin family protein [Rhizobacter sp.]